MIDIALTREEILELIRALGIVEDETGEHNDELATRLEAAIA